MTKLLRNTGRRRWPVISLARHPRAFCGPHCDSSDCINRIYLQSIRSLPCFFILLKDAGVIRKQCLALGVTHLFQMPPLPMTRGDIKPVVLSWWWLCPWGEQLATSRDSCDCHNLGCYLYPVGRGRGWGTAKHPTMHKSTTTIKDYVSDPKLQ